MTELKLVNRVTQSADRLDAYQTGVENELRERLVLVGVPGVVSVDGSDIDHDGAPCSLLINTSDASAIDVLGGTVVFAIGEFVTLTSSDIQAVSINLATTDSQVVRLEYGEVASGDPVANPYTNFATQPTKRKKTAREMLVVETTTAYNAQPANVKNQSVVLGIVSQASGVLTVDNTRDTFTYSRPWFSTVDATHRSRVGSGSVTVTNPHGTTPNDLSVGTFSMWQALGGQPNVVLARPTGFGRFPGKICSEVIPAGNFATDVTGLITGKAGALYASLGFWPDRILLARLNSGDTEVSAWIPHGRNVVAVFDPVVFASAADLEVFYTTVTAGSLPGSTLGLTTLTFSDPATNEVLIAGGNFFPTLTDKTAVFTDVGLIPMSFDVLVDNAGKVYKSPEVLYCNTKLDTIGAAPAPISIQPRATTRLRVGISNYNPALTQVQLQISGLNDAGSATTEIITFTGPLPAPSVAFSEVEDQRQFTLNNFSALTQVQVLSRINDGPNTAITIFAEHTPTQPAQGDDLLLATVHWSGSDISANYSNTPHAVIDRRLVSRGGGTRGVSSIGMMLNQPGLNESSTGGAPSGSTIWATFAEDFNDPLYLMYPQPDIATTTDRPIELPNNSLGARFGYQSRKMPFASIMLGGVTAFDALYIRMLPNTQFRFPGSVSNFQIVLTLYRIGGANVVVTGALTNAYPPFETVLTGTVPVAQYYAASINIPRLKDVEELFQGFILHARV